MKWQKDQLLDMYKTMQTIRKFELQASKSFASGLVQGFVHLYLGEEAIATGVCAHLNKSDYITSTHRGHGHVIAKGADLKPMMAELCGRATGYCKGKGGSIHIADYDLGILGANGIVGGGLNVGCGAALGCKLQENDNVCVCFFGDGATDTGAFHEAMNLASTWKLPVIFVNENNLYAESIRVDRAMAIPNIADRALAYNMPAKIVDGNDVFEVYDAAEEAVARARAGGGPAFIECKTYRWHGHFEGEPERYRPKEERLRWMIKEPIGKLERFIIEGKYAEKEALEAIEREIDMRILEAVDFAKNSPFPELETALTDVYTDLVMEGR